MCITIAVSQIFKLFHAIKFDGQLHGLALRKGIKEPLVSPEPRILFDKPADAGSLSAIARYDAHSGPDFLNFFQG